MIRHLRAIVRNLAHCPITANDETNDHFPLEVRIVPEAILVAKVEAPEVV